MNGKKGRKDMKSKIGWVGMVFSLVMILYFGGYRILLEAGGHSRGDIAVVCCFLPLLIIFASMVRNPKRETSTL